MKELFQHAAITNGITVRVAVSYLPEQSHPEAGKWFWVYHIRIENGSHEEVQLRTRHWRITDARGMVNHVDGEGVVGEQPKLAPGDSHDYVSGCPLTTPHGSMEGFYMFSKVDSDKPPEQAGNALAQDMAPGKTSPIEVRIPFFPLAAPETADGRQR